MRSHSEPTCRSSESTPLVVDLDGTLIRSDLLVESAFAHLGHDPSRIFSLFLASTRGKAALKAQIAEDCRQAREVLATVATPR